MPIYEYICNQCNKTFEFLLMSKDETVTCPFCHSTDLKRKVSLFSFGKRDSQGEFRSSTSSKCNGCSASSCSGCF